MSVPCGAVGSVPSKGGIFHPRLPSLLRIAVSPPKGPPRVWGRVLFGVASPPLLSATGYLRAPFIPAMGQSISHWCNHLVSQQGGGKPCPLGSR